MLLPTRLAQVAGLSNLPVRAGGAVRFFICEASHIEGWCGEEDKDPMPYRPCSVCRLPMTIVSLRLMKDGALKKFTRREQQKAKDEKKVRVVSVERLLNKLIKMSTRQNPFVEYKVLEEDVGKRVVGRVGDRPWRKGRLMYRRCVVLETMGVGVKATMKGVAGWVEDFRVAAKKMKLPIKFEFEQADDYKVIPYVASRRVTKR